MQNRKVSTIFFAIATLLATSANASQALHSLNVSTTAPEQVKAGEIFHAAVSFKNAGDAAWTIKQDISAKLISGADTWEHVPVKLQEDDQIPPGQSKLFTFKLTAPEQPGTYTLQWQLMSGSETFGEPTRPTLITVKDTTFQAKFISQVLPEQLKGGEEIVAKLQFQNSGSVTWSAESGYRLTAVHQAQKMPWGNKAIELNPNQYITPGDIATFSIPITAPEEAGTYAFQWQMHQKDSGWFGEASPRLMITVDQTRKQYDAEVVYQNIPKTMRANSIHSLTIAVKNNGKKSWNPEAVYLSALGETPFHWMIDRVDLASAEKIENGEMKAFKINVRAPSSKGVYHMQWQMKADDGKTFGDMTENMKVVVN